MGLGSMTVIHAAERVEGSEVVLPGVYAGGFDSLVHMTRQVRESRPGWLSSARPETL